MNNAITHLMDDTATLSTNASTMDCNWCTDSAPATFTVTQFGWTDFACFRHVRKYWPELLGDARPSEAARSFSMRLSTTLGSCVMNGARETYATFEALFRESRKVAELDGFELIHASSNKHYRATGHHRMVLRPAGGGHRSPRLVVHIVMK